MYLRKCILFSNNATCIFVAKSNKIITAMINDYCHDNCVKVVNYDAICRFRKVRK